MWITKEKLIKSIVIIMMITALRITV